MMDAAERRQDALDRDFEIKRALFNLSPDDYFYDWLRGLGLSGPQLDEVLNAVMIAYEATDATYIASSGCHNAFGAVINMLIDEVCE